MRVKKTFTIYSRLKIIISANIYYLFIVQIIVNSEDATDMVIYVYINDYKYLHDVTFVLFRKQMKMLTENTG